MLRRHIAGFMGDPHVAGEVVLRFSIDKQGNLLSYEIAKTSGDWRVDEAAVDMLRRAQPLPPIPDALNVPGFRVTMPLKYKL
jgi:periplasmic protein TonB